MRCRRGEYSRPIFDPRAQVHGADADHLKTAERHRVNVQAKGALKPLGSRVAVQQVFAPCCAVLPDLELTSFDVQRSSSVEFPFGFCFERSCACLRVGTVALGEVLFPLHAVFVSPPDLPPITLAVICALSHQVDSREGRWPSSLDWLDR